MCKHGWLGKLCKPICCLSGATSIRQGVELIPLGGGRSHTREKWRKHSHLGRF